MAWHTDPRSSRLRAGPADAAAQSAEYVNVDGIEDQWAVSVTLTAVGDESTPPTFRIGTLPAHGTLYSGIPEFGGMPILADTDYLGGSFWEGEWTWIIHFVPDPHWAGETGFDYSARFGEGASDLATATITLAPVADAPVVDANAHDQPDPIGTLQNVSATSGHENGPALAALDGGRTIIVWQQGLGPSSIKARFYDADGAPEGAAFDVPASGGASKVQPAVAGNPDGSFAISWVEGGAGTGGGDVKTAFYLPGSPVVVVTSAASSTGREADPLVTAAGDGYLVTWAIENNGAADHYARRYTAAGEPVGAPFLVASGAEPGFGTGASFDPEPYAVAVLGGGSFAIVTSHGDLFAGSTRLELVMVGADGSANTPLSFASGGTLPSIAALPQGGFVIAWTSNLDILGIPAVDVVAQRFDASGVPIGNRMTIATSNFSESSARVAALPDGRFVVTWMGNNGVDGSRDIFAQVFTADGVLSSGGPVAVTATGNANPDPFSFPQLIEESQPTIAVGSDGHFTLAWLQTRAIGGTNPDVFLRGFDPGVGIIRGIAGMPVDLPTLVALVDNDGSERLIELRISGLPANFTLAAGGRAGGDPSGDWIVDRSTEAGAALLDALAAGDDALTILTPADFGGDLVLEIRATSEDIGNPSSIAESKAGLVPMVIEPNTAPTTQADAYQAWEDQQLAMPAAGVLANDSDPNQQALTAILVDGPDHAASFTLNPDGSFSYRASEDFSGEESFTYKASDGIAEGGTVTVSIQVGATNDAPSGEDHSVETLEDNPYQFALADFPFADEENDGLSAIIIATPPANGSLRLDGVVLGAGAIVTAADIAAGKLSFQPDPDEYGDDYASFTFAIRDDGGVLNGGVDTDQSPNIITIDVERSNHAPIAGDDAFKLDEEMILHGGVLINDSDDGLPGQLMNGAILVTGPSHAAAFTFNPDGSFSYAPLADYTGTDSFTYKLNDGELDSNTATVTLTTNPVNDAPVGVGENYNVIEDTNLSVGAPGVLNNDEDVDGDALTAQLVTGPAHAASFSLNADGSFSYTPAADYVGADSFSYRPHDGSVQGNVVTVRLAVLAEDDAAIARNDAFAVLESGTLAANVFADNGSGADSDPDSGLAVASVNGSAANVGQTIMLASGATVRLNADGSFAYDPSGRFNTLTSVPTGASNTNAPDSFTYGLAGGGTANVVIQVNGERSVDDLLIGSAGNDTITDLGVNYNDSFLLQQGGNDSASGLAGDDGFYFGAAMNALDSVDGGTGTDSVALQGNYAALVLANMTNVENLVLLAGNNIAFGDLAGNFYDYNVTANDGNVGPGGTLNVIGGNLRAGEDLVFNGAAETDGSFRIFAGQGNDVLIGGARNDGFFFGVDANLTGADVVNGGGGIDTIALRGNYVGANAVVMQNSSMTNVETLAFLSGHTNEFGGPMTLAGFDYDFTTADFNVAAGQRLEVAAGNLRANESLRFDGRAELDGWFRIVSGAGDDNLFGGAGNDLIYGATGADRLEGGAGADTYLYRLATDSVADSRDLVIWGAGDRIDLSLVDANANSGANEAFTFIGAAAFTGAAGELRVTTTGTGANGIVEGDVNGDGVADLVIFVQNYVPVAGDFLL